jgi:hypothetical protein
MIQTLQFPLGDLNIFSPSVMDFSHNIGKFYILNGDKQHISNWGNAALFHQRALGDDKELR